MKTQGNKTKIVVLGAGYAGLSAFLALRGRLDWTRRALTLVNKHAYHYFTTELHTVAAGTDEAENVTVPLARVVRPPARLLVSEVDRILPEESRIILKPAPGVLAAPPDGDPPHILRPYFSLRYDYLIIALGSETEYFGLPGVRENSVTVRSLRSAGRLHARLLPLTALADGSQRAAVIIVGGGLTGVELATEMADSFGDRLDITLVEAAPDILPGLDPYLARASHQALEEKGVVIRSGTPVARADSQQLYLRDGTALPFSLLVWAGGVRGPAVLEASGFKVTRKGRGLVNDRLQAEGFPNVYMVGDCAAMTDPETGAEVPPTAQAAVQMGHAAARAILDHLRGAREQAFRPRMRGLFLSLGHSEGAGATSAGHYQGLPATVIKHLIEGHHAYEAGGLLHLLRRLFHRRRSRHMLRQPLKPRTH